MKHLRKFNESVGFEPDVNEINDLFKIHSYWLRGVEFSLDESEIEDDIKELENSRASDSTVDKFEVLANKYKGFRFENEETSGTSESDYDWESFSIDIIGPNNEHWIGFGQTCPAESPSLSEIRSQDEPDEKSRDYQEWLRLGNKWGFH